MLTPNALFIFLLAVRETGSLSTWAMVALVFARVQYRSMGGSIINNYRIFGAALHRRTQGAD
jgi:hypothetical protein